MNAFVSCFNCEGAGIEVFYPRIETLIACDAAKWILSKNIESFIADCPYCMPPKRDATLFLLWPGPVY